MKPELAARLQELAQEEGLPLEVWVRNALETLALARPPTAARESLTPEQRMARVHAAYGSLSHLPGSVDELLRRRQEEIDLEEEIWERRRAASGP